MKREKLNVFRAVREFLNFRNESMLLRNIACVTFCRWAGVLLMSLLIAVPPQVQINTHKIVKGVLYWTTTQQQLPITTVPQNNYIQKGISRRIVSHASLRMLNFLASVMREFYEEIDRKNRIFGRKRIF